MLLKEKGKYLSGMSSIRKRQILFYQFLLALIAVAVSCNSKADDTEGEIVVTYSTVAVKKFNIKANDSVMAHIDSVFFSIDLNTGVIFNADSLPKGTDVTKLVPSITFANSMSKAELSFMKDGKVETTDYLTNPDDSIDFSSPVSLNVTAADGKNSFTYQIKVNVHTQDPDTLIWNKLEMASLPSASGHPVAQKTVRKDEIVYTLVEENTGDFSLWSSADLNEGKWTQVSFNPAFEPNVESLTVTPSAYFLTSLTGDLYTSADLNEWTSTGETWTTVLGAYGDSVLGLKLIGNDYYHTQYPAPEGFVESPVEDNFPVANSSSLGLIETAWAAKPMAILAGGLTMGSEPTSAVWGYDGTNWSVLNDGYLPAVESPMMARYVVYRQTGSLFVQREFDVWLLFGGNGKSGEMNRNVYMSYDNGVNWSLAPASMQLSDTLPDLCGADVVVVGYPLSADLSAAWTPAKTKTRASWTINGYDITWMCPYMYVFGGYTAAPGNSLNSIVYRGVLERLQFIPQI